MAKLGDAQARATTGVSKPGLDSLRIVNLVQPSYTHPNGAEGNTMSLGRHLQVAAILAIPALTLQATNEVDYRAEIEAWRVNREEGLKADDGWLTVAGLFFLKNGENSFGADPLNDIVLPAGSAPAQLGVFEFDGDTITVRAAPGRSVTVNGRAVQEAVLRPSRPQGPADRLTSGTLTMFMHRSGERYAIRLRDQESRIRREFAGLRWFSVDEKYRVTAEFSSYAEPRHVLVPNILGDTETYTSPGSVVFTLDGQQFRMVPVWEGRELFFIFRDLTTGQETYPAARFLYAEAPADGKVVLDFNKAYNPPCAFNPYTTCPLPPPENRLRVRIEAGELDYQGPAEALHR